MGKADALPWSRTVQNLLTGNALLHQHLFEPTRYAGSNMQLPFFIITPISSAGKNLQVQEQFPEIIHHYDLDLFVRYALGFQRRNEILGYVVDTPVVEDASKLSQQYRLPAQPEVNRVMGKHYFRGITCLTQFGHVFHIDVEEGDDVEADAVESNIYTLGINITEAVMLSYRVI
jgi:hypothetical protein